MLLETEVVWCDEELSAAGPEAQRSRCRPRDTVPGVEPAERGRAASGAAQGCDVATLLGCRASEAGFFAPLTVYVNYLLSFITLLLLNLSDLVPMFINKNPN